MTYSRIMNDFNEKLDQQIKFMKTSIDLFYKGNEEEAIRLATSIRILLHDTSRSVSLLKQLGIKNEVMLNSIVNNYIPTNEVSYLGLCGLKINHICGYYYPSFNDQDNLKCKFIDFDLWWDEIVFDDKTYLFSRKDIVLFVANKDGGTHVDSELPESFYSLSHLNSLGFNFITRDNEGSKSIPMSNNPIYCSIASISQELLYSIDLFQTNQIINFHKLNESYAEIRLVSGNHYFVYFAKMDKIMQNFHKKLFADSRVMSVNKVNIVKQTLQDKSSGSRIERIVISK